MDFEEAQKNAGEVTGKLSDVARHLVFAGIAIVWVFSGGSTEKISDVELDDFRPTLFVFALSLFLDFSQYAWQSFFMRYLVRRHEEALKSPTGKGYKRWWRDVAEVLFVLKIVAVLVGYVMLLVEIGSSL